jgi:hypothetical protein
MMTIRGKHSYQVSLAFEFRQMRFRCFHVRTIAKSSSERVGRVLAIIQLFQALTQIEMSLRCRGA